MTNDNEREKNYLKINRSKKTKNKDFRYKVDRGMEKNVNTNILL